MENITITEKIKIMCGRAGLSLAKLAVLLGDSPQNFSQKLKRDNLRVNDLKKIADVLGYDLQIDFIEKKS